MSDDPTRKKIKFIEFRKELGMTQAQIADYLNIDQAEISKIERKKVIPVWLIRAIKLDRALRKVDKRTADLDV